MSDPIERIRAALAAGPTPGPWMFREWGSQIVDSGVGSHQLLVATVAVNTFRDQGRANAALIAAANPEAIAALLAERDALRDACAAMIAWDDREQDHSVDFGERMELCRVAFEKARAALAIGGGDV